jgi:hypothetical protein
MAPTPSRSPPARLRYATPKWNDCVLLAFAKFAASAPV